MQRTAVTVMSHAKSDLNTTSIIIKTLGAQAFNLCVCQVTVYKQNKNFFLQVRVYITKYASTKGLYFRKCRKYSENYEVALAIFLKSSCIIM